MGRVDHRDDRGDSEDHRAPSRRLFHEIIVSGEVGLIKPDREIFDLTLEKVSRRPEECVFIDDAKTNVDVAASMGFVAIHFESPEQLEEKLRGLGLF